MAVYLAIAKYAEDVSWIPAGDFVVKIYDKMHDYPNVGREAETFARFCVDHYDALKPNDTIFFLQGNPFDHCPDIVHKLALPIREVTYLGGLHTCDATGRPEHPGLPVGMAHAMLFDDIPEKWTFAAGAQYAVPGRCITHNSREFWVRLHSLLYHENVCAWTMERLWPCVFTSACRARR